MKALKFVYWQDGKFWLGYLQDFPDFMTQGITFEELKENLKDIYNEIVHEREFVNWFHNIVKSMRNWRNIFLRCYQPNKPSIVLGTISHDIVSSRYSLHD